jgi:maleylacetate reductase
VTGPRGKSDGQAVLDALPQEIVAGIYSNATMHTPEEVTADALKYANEVSADCAVGVLFPVIPQQARLIHRHVH